MPRYYLIEHSNNYLKTSRSLWQYYKDELFMNNDGVVADAPDDPDNVSFNYK